MRAKNPPPPDRTHDYAGQPPLSGNDINGLGVRTKKRPRILAPDDFAVRDYEWKDLWDFFFFNLSWATFSGLVLSMYASRNARGKVAPRQVAVDDPASMSAQLKEKAKELGASIVGITEARDDLLLYEGEESYPYKYAISIGFEQDREIMKNAPQDEAGVEVVRIYRYGTLTANKVAAYIRSLGWPAEAFGFGRDILMMPAAIEGGLGELGKHGSMISKEHGSNFRLTLVLTDLPLKIDEPVDIGVQDVCLTCQACTINCPVGAISDKRQMVRGVEKWYVDHDKCVWYFTKTNGCSICVEVCPWSEPGRGAKLSEIMLAKREKKKRAAKGESKQ